MRALAVVLATLVLSAGTVHAQQEVVEYYHLDAIGSVRAVSNQANVVTERHDYLPFGEECTTGPCATNLGAGAGQPRKFTSKERDQETGLDYFGARYYGARIARFTTVDPVYTWRENVADPQRWNRYAYSLNSPLRYVDPDGRAAAQAAIQIQQAGRQIFNASPHPLGRVAGAVIIVVGTVAVVASDPERVGKGIETAVSYQHSAGNEPWPTILLNEKTDPSADPDSQQPEKVTPSDKTHPKKERTLDGALDQLDGIEHKQEAERKAGRDTVDSVQKSRQDLKKELRKIKSSQDLEPGEDPNP